MGLLEKKREVLRQIEKLADTRGWNATASEISLESEYFSNIVVLFTRCMIEYPNLKIDVDCADEPYIENLSINIPYSNGYVGFNYQGRVELDRLHKLLEQLELVSELPEKPNEYLKMILKIL